jgi:tRNA-dihydrouridine synthase B
MITVHGRTREQGYGGQAEYDTIAAVKAAVAVPVVANGDIDTPEKARHVLAVTKADAVMIGRAALGRPWIFRELAHFMAHGTHLAAPLMAEVKHLVLHHLQDHYALYGEFLGVRMARKHIGWYVKILPGGNAFRERMNLIDDCARQTSAVADYFDGLNQQMDRLPGVVVNGLIDEKKEHGETTV